MNISNSIELEPLERAAADIAAAAEMPKAEKGTYAAPVLEALQAAGTGHVYADSADLEKTRKAISDESGKLPEGLDGNTVNQPLVEKVLDEMLQEADAEAWVRELSSHEMKLLPRDLFPLLYAVICGRIGNRMTRALGAGRGWEPNLQLHMGLCGRRHRAARTAHLLREICPNAIIKIPFTPDSPDCLLLARDLEQSGVPVNFTSTFSARQAVTAALLADVSRTNVFMGRLNQGLDAELLGEHVDLEAQRRIRELRSRHGVKTLLIAASIRSGEVFERVAGCDVFTAPEPVLREFLGGEVIPAEDLESRLEASYEDRLGVPASVLDKVGNEAPARLFRVEPELIEFLLGYANSEEIDRADGEILFKRFDEAGFGDMFHAPDSKDRKEMNQGKLPRLDGRMVARIPLDTHYSLLANADFTLHQEAVDAAIQKRLD